MIRHNSLVAGFVYVISLALLRHGSAADAELHRFEFESKHMGTTFRIVLYAENKDQADRAAKAGFDRVAELDRIMSDYKKDSELNQLCRKFGKTATRKAVPVSADLFAVLQKAEAMAKASDGAFDITVGPVVQLWRLARRTQQMPDPKEFAEARAKVGWQNVVLDSSDRHSPRVKLRVPGMQLDLGGIAKGYAADAVLTLLREKFHITRALVAASGDITCGDPPPGREAWAVDIAPIVKGQPTRTLALANCSVSTSGDLEQFVVINGIRYSHVLDPRTGLGLTGQRSVTVIARHGVTADSMTKAVSVLPVDKAFGLVDANHDALAATIVSLNDVGKPVVRSTMGFEKYLANPK